jgi:hypothetical protein
MASNLDNVALILVRQCFLECHTDVERRERYVYSAIIRWQLIPTEHCLSSVHIKHSAASQHETLSTSIFPHLTVNFNLKTKSSIIIFVEIFLICWSPQVSMTAVSGSLCHVQ